MAKLRFILLIIIIITCAFSVQADVALVSHKSSTLFSNELGDTTWTSNPLHAGQALHKLRQDTLLSTRQKFRESRNIFARFFRAFNDCDTNYIEHNRYNMMVRLNHMTSAEWFSLRGENSKQQLRFMSERTFKFGPFLRWRFIGAGYAMNMTHLGKSINRKTEMVVSFYSSMVGGDLMYRHTGSDFTLRGGRGFEQSLKPYRGEEFDGININMLGASMYYITNHRKYSQPAAFSQSFKQIRNAGSWKFGLSVTHHNIDIDYTRLNEQITGGINADMTEEKLKYMDYSFSAGYGYNWVFHHNWLLGVDIMPAIGYKRTSRSVWLKTEQTEDKENVKLDRILANMQEQYNKQFLRRGNINANIITRFATVWNNSHYYGGLSLVLYNFNYRYRELSMHDTFFTMTLFTGLNFWKQEHKIIKRRKEKESHK